MELFDFVNRANADYIDRLYQQYQKDPRSVDEPWRSYFAGFDMGSARAGGITPAGAITDSDGTNTMSVGDEGRHIGVQNLVHSYRELGHFVAKLDPLGKDRPNHPLLELSNFGIKPEDLDKPVSSGSFRGPYDGTLRGLIESLRNTYSRTIGVEYQDISDKAQRQWLAERMEPVLNKPQLPQEQRKWLLRQICWTQGFEEYCALKYSTIKRFGLDGGEALIPLINAVIDAGANLGIEEYVCGMAHRGRLNVLANVLEKPFEHMLAEFAGTADRGDEEGDGDVKYHLGYSNDRVVNGRTLHLALSFNPSHLELVNPVVEGIVRAKQYMRRDDERVKVVPILMHGDAAFTGQGIVQETLGLSEMPYWRTGGTVHIVINNQIGFTTMPKQGRFTPYPTDVARAIQAPVFHVNGDDPEACIWAAKLAIEFRQQFHCDVIIDLWCYRRLGHNEIDEPSFTQPLMYKQIEKHPRVREIYAQRLIEDKVVTEEEFEEIKAAVRRRLDAALDAAKESRPKQAGGFKGVWKGMTRAGSDWAAKTALSADEIRKIGEGCARIPSGFTPHPKLRPLIQKRLEMALGKAPLDWATAEQLAMGSLLLEGTPIRFTGQDVQRGTFSHRHACFHDYETGQKWYPLADMAPGQQAPFIIVNTMLSELAVLGFEYGFSSADPRNLVIWEAQFGDFVNGAQAIIDQFIVAAESKWGKMSGLVMLLPHGYEGQGPEHSSAYLERFLSLSAENNIQVIVPTLPSQHFHALRRQMKRSFRKPLIALMPKSLLRSTVPGSASQLSELTDGQFQLVIDDPANPDRDAVKRLLFCCGKVFYTLDQARNAGGVKDVAIVRVEQLYPFPKKEIQAIIAKYRNAHEVAWVQEEPKNRGAWTFMDSRLREMLPDIATLTYYGRDEAASPATGSQKMHKIEEEELIAHALDMTRLHDAHAGASGNAGSNGSPVPSGNGSGPHDVARAVAHNEPATAKSGTAVSG